MFYWWEFNLGKIGNFFSWVRSFLIEARLIEVSWIYESFRRLFLIDVGLTEISSGKKSSKSLG